MIEGLFVYTVIFVTGAFIALLLSYITKSTILSTIMTPVIIEISAMTYYYITEGAISQFGPIPYIVAFPFLALGAVLGSKVWAKFGKKPK